MSTEAGSSPVVRRARALSLRRLAGILVREVRRLAWLAETKPLGDRVRLGASYLRILTRRKRGGAATPRRLRLSGMTVNYFDRGPLCETFAEIFIRRDYDFVARTPQPLVIDAGANLGLATLFFKRRYPQACVLAFEPEPATFAALERNIQENGLDDVTAFPYALAAEDGDVRLTGAPGGLGTTTLVGDDELADLVVEARRLSSFIDEPVDMLKLDVEGAEYAVLEDLASTSRLSLIREMMVEYHHNLSLEEGTLARVLSLLETQGFGYQVAARFNEPWELKTVRSPSEIGVYQDVLVYAKRRE
jgi:FkbM family methyltransferase